MFLFLDATPFGGALQHVLEVDATNDLIIKTLLSEVTNKDVEAVRKAKNFYDNCEDMATINALGECNVVHTFVTCHICMKPICLIFDLPGFNRHESITLKLLRCETREINLLE